MSDNTESPQIKAVPLSLVEGLLLPSVLLFMTAKKPVYAFERNHSDDELFRIKLTAPHTGNVFVQVPVAVEYGFWDKDSESFEPVPADDGEHYFLDGSYDGPTGESSLTLYIHTI